MKKLLVSCLICLLISSHVKGQNSNTNFIIFVADDVSWNDFGYENSEVHTPNIDRLAANGLKFSNFYLTASSCSPSRNSIMTGRYPHNTGAAELHTEPPLDMLAFPELLRENNFYTGQAGKFHMGAYARRGFNVISDKGVINGDGGENRWVASVRERPKDKPFFMWFAAHDAHRIWGPNDFSGTHNPDNITSPHYLADGSETKADLAKYYDEITRFDHYIGEVVMELREQNIFEKTVIIIMADNGRPFPHSKTRVNDRGMKSPFVIHWPQVIESKGEVCEGLLSAIDIAPTIMDLAGVKYPEQFQGHSFASLLTNPNDTFRSHVFAEHNWHDYEAHERMVRSKDYMYILNSRPLHAQSGPADAVGSPSYYELDELRANGKLSQIQSDVFVVPRALEEFYDLNKDSDQLLNLASVPAYSMELQKLRAVLKGWMQETGDNIPDNLTKDWYTKTAGYNKTEYNRVRGEMPGAILNATQNNNKGIF